MSSLLRLVFRVLLVLLALGPAAAPAPAPAPAPPQTAPAPRPEFFGLRFPVMVAGFPRSDIVNFETDKPGLGYAVKYSGNGWAIDVYIYDAGHKDIPDSPSSDVVRGHLAQARGDIFARQQAGGVKVEETGTFQISGPNRALRFICGSYLISEPARKIDSYLCLTTWKGKFVKYRLSTLHGAVSTAATAKRFVSGWIAVLWPAPGRRAMLDVPFRGRPAASGRSPARGCVWFSSKR